MKPYSLGRQDGMGTMDMDDHLESGLSATAAVAAFERACNKNAEVLFITESWFAPFRSRLLSALPSSLDSELIEALRDALCKRRPLEAVVQFIEKQPVTWGQLEERRRRLAPQRRLAATIPMYPRDFLRTFVSEGQRSKCFVLMPFAHRFDLIYATVRDACESPGLLLTSSRADDFFMPGSIMEDIMRGIAGSDFVVADVTGKNPNVFYELGIAHSCKDASSVVIITQSMDDVPFDLRHMRCIVYRDDSDGLRELRAALERALASASLDTFRFSASEHQPFDFPERLTGHRQNFYRFTLDNLYVARGSAKFAISVHRESLTDGNATEMPQFHWVEEGNAIKIAMTDWYLRLDRTAGHEAFFSVVKG